MTTTETALVIIAAIMVLKGIVVIAVLVALWRSWRRDIIPLLEKTDGILKNVGGIAEAARDEVEEIKHVVDDLGYKAREISERVEADFMPAFTELTATIAGISRVVSFLFTRKR